MLSQLGTMLAAVTEAGHARGAPQASVSTLSGTCWHPSASQRDELPGFAALTCTLGEVAHPSLQAGLHGSRGPAWLPTAAVDGAASTPSASHSPVQPGLTTVLAAERAGGGLLIMTRIRMC